MDTKYKLNNLLMIPLDNRDNYINIAEKILGTLVKKKFEPPYYFRISALNGLQICVGVREFTANMKTIEVPQHIINYLGTEKCNLRLINNIPKGEFVKLKVNDESFYNIPDYDIFLSNELSNYCLLEKNKEFIVEILDSEYIFTIKELKIKIEDTLFDYDLVDIVNIDLKVDFEREITEEIIEEINESKEETIKEINESKEETIEEINESKEEINRLSVDEMRIRRLKFYDRKRVKEDL